MNIVLAGATGFIGEQLVSSLLPDGHTLTLLTRDPGKVRVRYGDKVRAVPWDPEKQGDWVRFVAQAQGVINLAGESLGGKRWTTARKEILHRSRIQATRALVDAMRPALGRPSAAALINASAVGYYGDVPEGDVDELHPPSEDFLGQLCQAWEKEALQAGPKGVRVVLLRLGVVLGRGGALAKMVTPFKFFLGGPLGSGRQWFPWVHEEDVVGAIRFALQEPTITGAVNVTAPNPVRQREFSQALGSALRRPSWLPVPAFALRLAVGEFAEFLLTGQRALPGQLNRAGYRFRYPELAPALAMVFHTPTQG